MSAASGVSSTAQNYEQLSYGGAASQHRGQHRQIIADAVATRTLLPKEAGALCMFDVAAGVVYTLPSPVIGMTFQFGTSVSRTSNAHKIITSTSTGTEFLTGGLFLGNSAAATGEFFAADGTTIRAVSSNGTTTGGIIGDSYEVVAISSTVWFVRGVLNQTGTAATPFATS
jgi:hypothetical protein